MARRHHVRRFAVIGLGRFGSRLAVNLTAADQEVIAIDKSVSIVEQLSDRVTLAVALDATDEGALRAQGVDGVDVAVVGMGDHFQSRVLATVLLKQLGVPTVIARAVTAADAQVMARVGADEVVKPEDESADRWAVRLANPWFLNRIELDDDHSLVEVNAPGPWVGKTLAQLGLRQAAGVHVVAIKRRGEGPRGAVEIDPVLRMPRPDQPLQPHDVLVVMGSDTDLARLPVT